ncbi:DUF3142 domain-containing protein, partial [Pseudomonas aeruginosa]
MVPYAQIDLRRQLLGQGTEVLLVRRWRAWLAGLLLGLPLLPSVEAAVRAEDYGAFWLWSGVVS